MARRVNLDDDFYLKLLLYGQAGSTKTRTAATAMFDERTAPVLWLDEGGNPLSIRSFDPLPDIIQIQKLEEYNPIYAWLEAGQPKDSEVPKVLGLQTKEPYKTVVIDGLTGTQRLSFDVVLGETTPKPGAIPQSLEFKHFNKVLRQMTKFGASFFYTLPMHVIMTALEYEKQGADGVLRYGPLLWGQSAGELPGQALAVARMMHIAKVTGQLKTELTKEVPEEVVSIAIFQPSSTYVAKDQYTGQLTVMYNPTVTKILDSIYAPKVEAG